MIERPDADALLAGPLGDWLTSQNADRAAAKAKVAFRQKLAVAAACVVAFGYILINGSDIIGALQFGFFAGVAGFGWAALASRPVLTRLKSGINGAIAKALDLEYSASVTPGKVFERAKTFEMVPSYDDDSYEDLWWGVLGTQPFTLHEAKLTEERGSGKSRRTVTVFAGSIISIGFTRNFIGTTLIERKSAHRSWLGLGGAKERITLNGIELGHVDMVDPRFEEAFAVWSDDGVEARYLVHPDYAERLTAVELAYAGKNIRALFSEGELLIVLESGDLFESGSLDAGDDRALVGRTIEQFTALTELATKLNERPRAGFN
jgi:Protein of unknown function (DUF3137)